MGLSLLLLAATLLLPSTPSAGGGEYTAHVLSTADMGNQSTLYQRAPKKRKRSRKKPAPRRYVVPIVIPDTLTDSSWTSFAPADGVAWDSSSLNDGVKYNRSGDKVYENQAPHNNIAVELSDEQMLRDQAADPHAVKPTWNERELASRVRYPEIARNSGIEGRVVAHVQVSSTGTVTAVRIVQSDSHTLDAATEEAIRATTFTPGTWRGVARMSWVEIAVNFRLAE